MVADIEVDKVVDMVADMEFDMVAKMEVDKVADMVADNKKKSTLTSVLTWKSSLVRKLVTGVG